LGGEVRNGVIVDGKIDMADGGGFGGGAIGDD
jgi:hypothetical protein